MPRRQISAFSLLFLAIQTSYNRIQILPLSFEIQ